MGNGQPGGRAPAPGGLAFVQALVNTADLEFGTDELDAGHAAQWASTWQLPPPSEAERVQLVNLREALRQWLAGDKSTVPGAVASLIDAARLTVAVKDGAIVSSGQGAVGTAIGRVVDAVREAMLNGSWLRLKICERSVCRWVYYDRSKNSAAHWCSTDICGAREKSHRAYLRRSRGVTLENS